MSLLGVLNNYNRGNYKLNPVVVQEQDYNVYYGGISNGLLWPALHNLPEYIVSDYDTPKDFIWIHDYHLMLTGMVMQSLDPNLENFSVLIEMLKDKKCLFLLRLVFSFISRSNRQAISSRSMSLVVYQCYEDCYDSPKFVKKISLY
ncbi:hypothetical protein DICVIV_05049 [Dictyocaulus viviparus]|uniref:Glyco_transf_20 domain-containing protein n=1 Tax=Dictyocaulus viviparus TaxID=29172 RepID=A0A0D8XYM7_DICVI|nr:hypothetical protein DICVIV_05049 [Dictyocaulus viviparus]